MLVSLAQQNPIVGDLQGNMGKIFETLKENDTVELLVFPELFLTGYPPKDLLYNRDFLQALAKSLKQIQTMTESYPETTLVLGTPWQENSKLFNSAVVFKNGEILGTQHKRTLTQFALFDENQYFTTGEATDIIEVEDYKIGLTLGMELDQNLVTNLRFLEANFIINLVALPFQLVENNKFNIQKLSSDNGVSILRVGQVGANDELIFAGGTCAFNETGNILANGPDFEEAVVTVDFSLDGEEYNQPELDETAQIYDALVLGLEDYLKKNGMSKVILGLSGGLDSAVAAVIATEAVGPENVWAITQPGPFSPSSSMEDAEKLAENLGICFNTLSIRDLYEKTLATLDELFAGTTMGVAEENIQARLRGMLWMTLSNKFGGLVLTNSNKSELAVGYCTLYGDMNGGLAILGDVYKTMVYQLAYYINRKQEVIPWNTIEKPPSAELRPDQRDDETLPPYDILDSIIRGYLDEKKSISQIIAQRFDREIVQWVVKAINNNDYKRRQAALILRITSPVLGLERKMPLAARKYY